MAALWFQPLNGSKPVPTSLIGAFYPTRLCQGPENNCHGGSTFTFTDAVATMLAGSWFEATHPERAGGHIPYISTKTHELTYKDGVPLGTISGWRSTITDISEGSDGSSLLSITTRIFRRDDPKGLSDKFAVEAKSVVSIPAKVYPRQLSSPSNSPIRSSIIPLEQSLLSTLLQRQPELAYIPPTYLSILLPLLRNRTHVALRLPESTSPSKYSRRERYFREHPVSDRRIFGLYFLGKSRESLEPNEVPVGDLRTGAEIVGLVYFHPKRSGSGNDTISHGAQGAFIDSTYGMLINTLLLSAVRPSATQQKGKKPTLATHQYNFRTLLLRLDFNSECKFTPTEGVKLFRTWVIKVEKSGRKTTFGGQIFDVPLHGPGADPQRAKFIDDSLIPVTESESLFLDASKKYGGRPIGWGTGEDQRKQGGFETGKL